jgi:hypothetical protein
MQPSVFLRFLLSALLKLHLSAAVVLLQGWH